MPNAPPSPPSVRAISSRSDGSDALICVTRILTTLPTGLWTANSQARLQHKFKGLRTEDSGLSAPTLNPPGILGRVGLSPQSSVLSPQSSVLLTLSVVRPDKCP